MYGAIVKEVMRKKLRLEWKKICDDIAEKTAIWISEFIEKEFRDDLRCMIYAQMINKSREA